MQDSKFRQEPWNTAKARSTLPDGKSPRRPASDLQLVQLLHRAEQALQPSARIVVASAPLRTQRRSWF
jgi:hypothetical protein